MSAWAPSSTARYSFVVAAMLEFGALIGLVPALITIDDVHLPWAIVPAFAALPLVGCERLRAQEVDQERVVLRPGHDLLMSARKRSPGGRLRRLPMDSSLATRDAKEQGCWLGAQ